MVDTPFSFDRDITTEGFQTPRDIYQFESIFGPKGPNMNILPKTQEEIDQYNNTRQQLLRDGVLQPGDIPEIDPENKFDVPEDTETSKKIDDFFVQNVLPVLDKMANAIPAVGTVKAGYQMGKKAVDWATGRNTPVNNVVTQPGDTSWGSGGTGSQGDGGPSSVDTPGGEDFGAPNGDMSVVSTDLSTGETTTDTGAGYPGDGVGSLYADGGEVRPLTDRARDRVFTVLDKTRKDYARKPISPKYLDEVVSQIEAETYGDIFAADPEGKVKDALSESDFMKTYRALIKSYITQGMTEREVPKDTTENYSDPYWNELALPDKNYSMDKGIEVPFEAEGRTKFIDPQEYNPGFEDMNERRYGSIEEDQISMAKGGNVKKPAPKEGTVKKTTVVIDDKGKTQKVQKDISKGANKVSEIIQRAPPKAPKKPVQASKPKMAEGGSVPMPQMIADPSAAPPEAMADDVPMKAKEGDFIVNMDAVNSAGMMDIKKMINTALEEASMDGKQIVAPNEEGGHQGNPVDIFVHNGEVHIPKELVAYIGEDKLTKLNNRGLKKRAEREEQEKQKQASQMLPQNIANYQGTTPRFKDGGEVATPFPQAPSSIGSKKNPRGFYLRRKPRVS